MNEPIDNSKQEFEDDLKNYGPIIACSGDPLRSFAKGMVDLAMALHDDGIVDYNATKRINYTDIIGKSPYGSNRESRRKKRRMK